MTREEEIEREAAIAAVWKRLFEALGLPEKKRDRDKWRRSGAVVEDTGPAPSGRGTTRDFLSNKAIRDAKRARVGVA